MAKRVYARIALASLVLTVFLVAVGGSVRVTGAGLGCPDWPKCWGSWLPPMELSEVHAREHVLGLIAQGRLQGPYDAQAYAYNRDKMLIEYVNRLVGVLLGMVIAAQALCSFGLLPSGWRLLVGSWAALFLVGFQGWLGALVVRSGLKGSMITLHMFGALVLLAVLVWLASSSRQSAGSEGKERKQSALGSKICLEAKVAVRADEVNCMGGISRFKLRWGQGLLLICLALVLAQALFGAMVRQAIGPLEGLGAAERTAALEQVGRLDHWHRSFSWVVLLAVAGSWWFFVRKFGFANEHARAMVLVLVLLLLQMALGVLLVYGAVPAWAQLGHLVCVTLFYTLLWWRFFALRSSRA